MRIRRAFDGLLVILVAHSAAAESPERLFDGGGRILPSNTAVSERLADSVFEWSVERSLFSRAVTVHEGESIRFELPGGNELYDVRWIANPHPGVFEVFADGEPVPVPRSMVWRRAQLPSKTREIEFRAREGAAHFAEPILVKARREPGASPDLLLITIDTLRADAWPTDTLAARFPGFTIYDDAIAPSSWTIPTFVSLFTGTHPIERGITGRTARIPDGVPTIAEELRAAGYLTHAIAQNTMLAPDGGFARGFDAFDFHASDEHQLRPAAEVTDLAVDWLRAASEAPSFLWVHYFEPHGTYAAALDQPEFEVPTPSDQERIRSLLAAPDSIASARALYQAEVDVVQAEVSRLLDAWDRRSKRTLVVITSDHGEEFAEHGTFGHGHSVFEETIRVPLMVRLPGAASGTRVAEQTSLVDLAPTLRIAAGISSRRSVVSQATALVEWRKGKLERVAPQPRWVLTMATLYDDVAHPAYGVRWGSRKFVWWESTGPEDVLSFDLADDPGEKRPESAHLPRAVRRRLQEIERALENREASDEPGTAREDQLRALGYLD